MCGVSAEAELLERALHFVAERRARQRLEQRAAEIERAQLGERQPGGEALERLAVDLPPRAPIVSGPIVEERKPRFFERLQIAADRAGRHAAERGEIVDGDAGRPRARSISRRIVHCRMTSAFRGTLTILPAAAFHERHEDHEDPFWDLRERFVLFVTS